MLKIWLNWLQPSLGVLGTALVLSNPLCSSAAPNSVAAKNISKVPAQPPHWSSVKPVITNVERNFLKGIAVTPDVAVRQLAINTMMTSGMQSTAANPKTAQSTNALANFISTPARVPQLSAKASKPKANVVALSKPKANIVASATQSSKARANVVVPGLFIGRTDIRVSTQLPTIAPIARSLSLTTGSGTQASLAAMMSAKTVASPYPVVSPALMQQLKETSTVASVPEIKTASLSLKAIRVAPKAVETPSLNPIAAIPSGLQQLLGNNLNGGSTVASAPVATATTNNSNSLLALQKLILPTEATASTSVTTASLQLATSQAYTSVAKFNIPGEIILAAKSVTPTAKVPMLNRVQQNSTIASVGSKSIDYTTLMSNRRLTSATRQSWLAANQSSNLGGLILGSQQLATVPKVIGLLPMSSRKSSIFTGLTVSDLGNIN